MLLGINHLRPCCELNKHIKSESPEFWMHRKLNIQHVLPKLNYQSMGNCSDNHHHNLCCGVRQGPENFYLYPNVCRGSVCRWTIFVVGTIYT